MIQNCKLSSEGKMPFHRIRKKLANLLSLKL